MINKESVTKLAPSQFNTMKAIFAQFEALVTSMVVYVKSNAFQFGKAKDQEDTPFFSSNVNPSYFCGVGFSCLLTSNEAMLNVSYAKL